MVKKIKFVLFIVIVFINVYSYTIKANKSIVKNDSMFLSGNVRIKADHYYLKSDSGILLSKQSIIFIPNYSTVKSGDSISLVCEELYYFINKKYISMLFQKTVKNNNIVIKSDSAMFNTERDYAEYFNNCNIEIKNDSFNIFAKKIILKGNEKYIQLNDSIEFYSKDKYKILCDSMHIIIDSVYKFKKNIQFINDKYKITSDSLILYKGKDMGLFYGNNGIKTQNSELYATLFKFYLNNNYIDILYAMNNVEFSNTDSNGISIIQCDSAIIDFEHNKIQNIKFSKTKKASINFKNKE